MTDTSHPTDGPDAASTDETTHPVAPPTPPAPLVPMLDLGLDLDAAAPACGPDGCS